jgi:hypothetical protein
MKEFESFHSYSSNITLYIKQNNFNTRLDTSHVQVPLFQIMTLYIIHDNFNSRLDPSHVQVPLFHIMTLYIIQNNFNSPLDPSPVQVPLFHIIPQKTPGQFISFYTHANYSANFIFS